MATNDPIYKAFGPSDGNPNGKLTREDFNFLLKQFNDFQTPEGERLGQQMNRLMTAVKPTIDKSNPLMGKIDETGPLRFYDWEFNVQQKVAEYRKQGRNWMDLFDPNKPDYVGNAKYLQQFQKPLNESIADTVKTLTGGQGARTPPIKSVPVAPPVPGAKQGFDGRWYVERNGKQYPVIEVKP